MGYLAQVYIQSNELDEARKLLERMIRTEPEHTSTLLTLANVCYMQEDYAAIDVYKRQLLGGVHNLFFRLCTAWTGNNQRTLLLDTRQQD